MKITGKTLTTIIGTGALVFATGGFVSAQEAEPQEQTATQTKTQVKNQTKDQAQTAGTQGQGQG
ncbi:MAG: hypothetical protein ABFS37_10560, partial [Acidobacteriota bacterium]